MSGEIVVLGGLQRTVTTKSTSRLGPIPIIGDIFGSSTNLEEKQELIIFLRPYVLNGSAVDNLDALSRAASSAIGPEVKKVIDNGPEGFARDVRSIKADLEADNQVVTADVRRRGDGTLDISLRERLAIAKIASLSAKGAMQVRLVASDGQTFAGAGYPEQVVRNLPEITDSRTTGSDDKMLIDGIEIAAPFLLAVRTTYPNLYKQWSAVSLRDCFGAQEDSPGSNLRVAVRPGTQPMDRPAVVEIIFSTANWRNELALLSRINVDEMLRRPGTTAQAYVLKMSIQNRTNGASPVPEPRLVPLVPLTPR
jgi:hypothetical protein